MFLFSFGVGACRTLGRCFVRLVIYFSAIVVFFFDFFAFSLCFCLDSVDCVFASSVQVCKP
jgi:hypothetical protein